jgi:hypothetical protein
MRYRVMYNRSFNCRCASVIALKTYGVMIDMYNHSAPRRKEFIATQLPTKYLVAACIR